MLRIAIMHEYFNTFYSLKRRGDFTKENTLKSWKSSGCSYQILILRGWSLLHENTLCGVAYDNYVDAFGSIQTT